MEPTCFERVQAPPILPELLPPTWTQNDRRGDFRRNVNRSVLPFFSRSKRTHHSAHEIGGCTCVPGVDLFNRDPRLTVLDDGHDQVSSTGLAKESPCKGVPHDGI